MRQHTTQKPSQPCPLAFSLYTAYLSIHRPYFYLPILRRKVTNTGIELRLGCSTLLQRCLGVIQLRENCQPVDLALPIGARSELSGIRIPDVKFE